MIASVMTLHKLSAGDGYAYYTSEVASADELRAEGRELGDYYTVEGMPPGQWVAHSEALLGFSGEVTEAQMAALFTSPGQWEQLSHAGRRHVELHYSPQVIGANFRALYESVLARHRGRGK